MNWIYEILNHAGFMTELSGSARRIEVFCFVGGLWCVSVMFLFGRYLVRHLLPVFDVRWSRHLPFQWAKSLDMFPRFARASTYASWVVNPRLFARSVPAVRGYDFAAEVTPHIRRMCVFYVAHLVAFVFSVATIVALQVMSFFLR